MASHTLIKQNILYILVAGWAVTCGLVIFIKSYYDSSFYNPLFGFKDSKDPISDEDFNPTDEIQFDLPDVLENGNEPFSMVAAGGDNSEESDEEEPEPTIVPPVSARPADAVNQQLNEQSSKEVEGIRKQTSSTTKSTRKSGSKTSKKSTHLKSINYKTAISHHVYVYTHKTITPANQTGNFDSAAFSLKIGEINSATFEISKLHWGSYKNKFVVFDTIATATETTTISNKDLFTQGNYFRLGVTSEIFDALKWTSAERIEILNNKQTKHSDLKPLVGIKNNRYHGRVNKFLGQIKTFYREDGNNSQTTMQAYQKTFHCSKSQNIEEVRACNITINDFERKPLKQTPIATDATLNKNKEYFVEFKNSNQFIDISRIYPHSTFSISVLHNNQRPKSIVNKVEFNHFIPVIKSTFNDSPKLILDPIIKRIN